MAHVNLWVPDSLYERMRSADDDGAELNWSGTFQEAIRAELARVAGCRHERLRCADCGAAAST